jgi:hypothetical protein
MIPKVIHYLWLSDEKPSDVEQCLSTWKEKLVGYEIKEWNKTNFPYQDFLWTREAYSAKKWAFVTDFFRLWVLENYGGIYMDADVVVNGSFDDYLCEPMFIGIESSIRVGPHAMGARKGHPYIHQCLQYYNNRHFIKEDGSLDMTPIPRIMTKVFMKFYNYGDALIHFDGTPLKFNDIIIYPDTYFNINIFDGKNVCYHNAYGSWRDRSTARNRTREEIISEYFLNKHFCYSLNIKYRGLKRILYLMIPVGLLAMTYKYKLKIKNNKIIESVDYPSNRSYL